MHLESSFITQARQSSKQLFPQRQRASVFRPIGQSMIGVGVAGSILLLWGGSLLFFVQSSHLPLWAILLGILGRTFLHTGLFIVAHDAMHGVVAPSDRWLNHTVGRLALVLYAFLVYDRCLPRHWEHHRRPTQPGTDPDFHNGQDCGFFSWYCYFMSNYLDRQQIKVSFVGLTGALVALLVGCQASIVSLLLFWIIPMLLSSFQLFYFGTYLPHREPAGGYTNRHCARSSGFPVFWSFLSCYHFGYHWEHHEYPNLPWYHLPSARSS